MSVAACAGIVERGDPDRFLATMAAPVAAREKLFPLYALNVEVTRAPWVSQEPIISQMRMQWWREVLGEIAAGKPARAHEVVAPLATALEGAERVFPVLDALIEARMLDVEAHPFADAAALSDYIEHTSAGLMWSAAQILGAPPEAEAPVRAYGWAAGLANYFRAVPDLDARARHPLPDRRPEALAALARDGLQRIASARQGPRIPASAYPALWAGWRAKGCLAQVAADPEKVAAGALEDSDFARRAGLLRRVLLGRW